MNLLKIVGVNTTDYNKLQLKIKWTKMNKQSFRLRRGYLALFKEIQAHCGIIYTDPAVCLLTCPLQDTTAQQQRRMTQATPD